MGEESKINKKRWIIYGIYGDDVMHEYGDQKVQPFFSIIATK